MFISNVDFVEEPKKVKTEIKKSETEQEISIEDIPF
jgi:hypothetical protein